VVVVVVATGEVSELIAVVVVGVTPILTLKLTLTLTLTNPRILRLRVTRKIAAGGL
jgi:hypothetical protein